MAESEVEECSICPRASRFKHIQYPRFIETELYKGLLGYLGPLSSTKQLAIRGQTQEIEIAQSFPNGR